MQVSHAHPLAVFGLAALALGVVSDLAGHQTPFRWIYANFAMNIGDAREEVVDSPQPVQFRAGPQGFAGVKNKRPPTQIDDPAITGSAALLVIQGGKDAIRQLVHVEVL